MSKPLIYISYGMAKSGSTLGFQLASAVLEEAGVAQGDLDLRTAMGAGRARFVEVIRPRELAALGEIAAARPRAPIVVKTHGGLWKRTAAALDEGRATGHAICRDPRDIALSMMDASRAGRAWGRRDGQPLRHIEDALDYVRAHAEKFEKWAAHPAIMAIPFVRLAFDTERVAGEIASRLGVEVDARRCARMAKAARTNRNLGLARRHETEMAAEVSARVGAEFAGFIERWCAPDFAPPKRGLLGRLTGG